LPAVTSRLARSRQRRSHSLARVPESLRTAVERFAAAELANQRRAARVGSRPRANQTLHIHLGVIADFACANDGLVDWASVSMRDIEEFLAKRSPAGSHVLPSLRAFFVWARSSRLILADPTRDLHSSAKRHFSGPVIDLRSQRRLFHRWTTDESVHPNEALIGLFALLHGASVDELRQLVFDDLDEVNHTAMFSRRPHRIPLDPHTWSALERALHHRDALGTANPHVLVNRRTKVTGQPVARGYPSELFKPLGITPKQLRCSRIAQLVTTTDPKLVTELFGITNFGVEYYLGDQVDEARLTNL
jgi:integrase